MSDRSLLALALLVGAAAPLHAQGLAQLRRHEADLTRRLATLEAQAASADSTRFADQRRRIVTVGSLVMALPEWVTDADTDGLGAVVAARRERYGEAFSALLTDTLVVWVEPDRRDRAGTARGEWRPGPTGADVTIQVSGEDPSDWVSWIASIALDKWALGRIDPALAEWLGAADGSGTRAALRDASVRGLVLSSSGRGRRCLEGAMTDCALLLELGGSAEPLLDAYDPTDLRGIADRVWTGRSLPGRASCLAGRDPAACRAYLRRSPIVPSRPSNGALRQGLFVFALERGGEGAWQRIRGAAGRPLPEQLAAAARTPFDELLVAWHADLHSARRTTEAGLGPTLMFALGWLVLATLIFSWRYRWRRV